ncbi:PAS domain-containing protein [Chitinophaga pendula]|uniref:ATP-binding protein n=1 Tax=Chitinophaga TaxID=79328 RepID=UPI000BAFD93E|nr:MULTISPECIES: ATP-binding protein [Chitinophaga]ASZ10163.1 hypothetical protein CK934_03790 [Chitinophaga sp. MD30]UCJ06882.1 PAS domain-containing protein [Chitinophaga pendula]
MSAYPPLALYFDTLQHDTPLWQQLIDHFPASVYITAMDGYRIVSANERATGLLGYTLQQTESSIADIFSPEDWKLLLPSLELLKRQEQSCINAIRQLKAENGSSRLGHITVFITGSPDTALHLVWIIQDVTGQMEKGELLRTTQELVCEIEDLLQFGSWTWWPEDNNVQWSDGIYKLLGYERTSLPREPDFSLYMSHVSEEDADWVNAALYKAVSQKEPFEMEYDLLDQAGKRKKIHAKGKYVYDHERKQDRFIGVLRDISTVWQLEQDRKRYIQDLRRSNKELEEFAYVASHDLQEPLRKILTFGDLLNNRYREQLGNDGKQYIDRMMKASQHMQQLINDLLTLSRISSRKPDTTSVKLDEVLQGVLADMEETIRENNAEIIIHPLPEIKGYHVQFQQLFTNLLGNAVKFRDKERPPRIEVSCRILNYQEVVALLLDVKHTWYEITVADNGIGFENIHSHRIFQVFQRLHGKTEYPGTGLGLSICQKIIENHGGKISATGIPGEGARFIIHLPDTGLTD